MTKKCPACSYDNLDSVRFCVSCGVTLDAICPNCGAATSRGYRFCGSCGESLQRFDVPARVQIGERRRVTILFVDLVGFSTLAEHLDPEELHAVVAQTLADLARIVEEREGVIEKFIGDAIMAVFGVPLSHEDDPRRAVGVAMKMLEYINRRSADVSSPLQIRVGINSGLVVWGATGGNGRVAVMGDAVNVAARLQQSANPNEVMVSVSVWRRVRDYYHTQAVGHVEVKGREQSVEAYRILRTRTPSVRRATPFVGRAEERALLSLLWSSALKGNTHIVSLVGEPGVGKSRLLGEFHPAHDGALDLRVKCGPERAFGPFLEIVEKTLGRLPRTLDDLRDSVAILGVQEDVLLLLAAFLGLAGAPPIVAMADEQQKRQVFSGVWQFLALVVRDRPALIVLDYVHWSDRSSLDLLAFLLERLGGVPLVLVLAYRPGFQNVERTNLRASHTAIRLEPLSAEQSVELAREVLGVSQLPSDLERIVAHHAEGNPFFIEELLQALLELNSLEVVDGTAVLAKAEIEIPDTVQGTILARIDRQAPEHRGLLQHAAVIGYSFTTEMIQAVMDEDDLSEALDELAHAQLLVIEGSESWAFKHALIRDVAYEMMLHRQRKELHRKVAQALEERTGDDPSYLEVLAEHYARGEVLEKARHFALAAGDAALERMGFVEARYRYEAALGLWGEGDTRGRLELLMKAGWAALWSGDPWAARTALIEAASGWEALGENARAGAALATLGRVYFFSGEMDKSAQVLRNAIELLEPEGSSQQTGSGIRLEFDPRHRRRTRSGGDPRGDQGIANRERARIQRSAIAPVNEPRDI